MNYFEIVDRNATQVQPVKEEPKQHQMPVLTLAEIDAMQQQHADVQALQSNWPPVRKKPGPKPKVK